MTKMMSFMFISAFIFSFYNLYFSNFTPQEHDLNLLSPRFWLLLLCVFKLPPAIASITWTSPLLPVSQHTSLTTIQHSSEWKKCYFLRDCHWKGRGFDENWSIICSWRGTDCKGPVHLAVSYKCKQMTSWPRGFFRWLFQKCVKASLLYRACPCTGFWSWVWQTGK